MKKLLILLAVCGAFAFASPALASNGTVSGTITHASDGTAVPNMTVLATNTTTGVLTTGAYSGADGAYTMTLASGTYDLTTSTTTSEAGVVFLKKTLTVTVGSDETKSGQDFAVTRRGKFTGHVVASGSGTAISSATITSTHISGYTSGSAYTTSLSNGSYIATPTASDASQSAVGGYTFTVTKAGYFSASVTNATLTADEATSTQDITLVPASTVSGTITDSSGTGIGTATVTLLKSTGWSYAAQTNAAGAYTVSIFDTYSYNGTAVGDYTVTVSKSGYLAKTASLSITDDSTALTGNNYTLTAAGVITGTIKDSAGNALSGVAIVADDGFGYTYVATTGSDGTYSVTGLRSSTRYTLTATKSSYVGQKLYGITVTAGATTSDKNITLPTAKTFSGTVVSGSNEVLEGAIVFLYKRNKSRSEVADFTYVTKSDGSFVFTSVSPGKYRVKVTKTGYISYVLDSLAISANITGRTIKLDLGGSIYGKTSTGSNSGVAGAVIAVYALKNGKQVSYTSATTDENGFYLVSGLKKGTYRLQILTTEYVQQLVNVSVKNGLQTTKNVKLAVAGSVSGFLTDKATKLPLASTIVRVVGTSITTSSDANGFYTLDGISAGKRKIVAINPYYDIPGQQTVTVTAGKTKTDVNFSLKQKE
ncbi:MAG: carboxypeptidase regulatory-like domain-containing protein [bacterium]